jgi:molybdopterin molybdotransferase
MISVDALRGLLNSKIRPIPPRCIHLAHARGLILAEEVLAEFDEPAFDRSAMDGFAIHITAPPGRFEVIGESLPGGPIPPILGPGKALRVFTGSALPPSVRVMMQEDVKVTGTTLEIATFKRTTHVRLRGSAKQCGDRLLPIGTRLHPAALAILASAGRTHPLVQPRTTVAHLTTGSEIIEASQTPVQGQVRDTNGPLIRALLEESDASFLGHKHTSEDVEAALDICRESPFTDADLLLISGGSSGGAHDHTAEILERLGFGLICRKVNSRPGKPLIVGLNGNKVAVGLPGNPVSHFVTFHLFVRHILSLQRGVLSPEWRTATICNAELILADPRETFWPAQLRDNTVEALPWLDSGHLTGLLEVNALIRVPSGRTPTSGEPVEYIDCRSH